MHATPDSSRIATMAIDLAKDVFELAFADAQGQLVERRRLTRTAFVKTFDNTPPRGIAMEACGIAHHWARRFQRGGHAVSCCPRTWCVRMCAATRPTVPMPPACSKPSVAQRFARCR